MVGIVGILLLGSLAWSAVGALFSALGEATSSLSTGRPTPTPLTAFLATATLARHRKRQSDQRPPRGPRHSLRRRGQKRRLPLDLRCWTLKSEVRSQKSEIRQSWIG